MSAVDDVLAWLDEVEKDPVRANNRVAAEFPNDERKGVVLEIDPDSPKEFMDWLDGKIPYDKHGGDHPWEIKRGGNTTHIDLYVGLIPESDSLHRGWQGFPSDFKIADVMHFSSFGRARQWALPHVSWKPLPTLTPLRH